MTRYASPDVEKVAAFTPLAGARRVKRQFWPAILGKRQTDIHFTRGWDDHGELWIRDGRAIAYTAHPYDLDDDERAELAGIAFRHGIRVEIRDKAESWYYPGQSWLVVLWAPGVGSEEIRRNQSVAAP